MKEEKKEIKVRKANFAISTSEKVGLVSNLHTMLAAGIPILEVVNSLLEDAKGNQKKVLIAMRDDLGQGQHLYYTFAKFPRVFDKVTVSIIKASEEAGTLDDALKDMKANILKDREFNDRIRGAMIYPVFIMGVFVVVMIVILIVVVPRISTVFSRMKVELPLPTQIMFYFSNALLEYPFQLAIGATLFVTGLIYLFKRFRIFFIRILISLPVISKLARQIDLTRFSRSLYLLLNAGVPITTALELSQEVVIKKEIYDAIRHSRTMVQGGKKFSQGLKDHKGVLPSIMIKIIEAGEKSGSLSRSMEDITEYLDYEVSSTLKTVTAMIEPLLLVIVGVLIGGMMVSIIAPMYGLISQVGGGPR
jgi:type II secretory pathway component PulF